MLDNPDLSKSYTRIVDGIEVVFQRGSHGLEDKILIVTADKCVTAIRHERGAVWDVEYGYNDGIVSHTAHNVRGWDAVVQSGVQFIRSTAQRK